MEVLQNWPIKEGSKEDSIFTYQLQPSLGFFYPEMKLGHGTQELSLDSHCCSELPFFVAICEILCMLFAVVSNVGCAGDASLF